MGYLAHAHAEAKPGPADSHNARVDNLPVVNVANAGRSIPVKFGLGGDQGLNIFAPGYPLVSLAPCAPGPADAIDAYAQGGGLSYDPQSRQYSYVRQTQKM